MQILDTSQRYATDPLDRSSSNQTFDPSRGGLYIAHMNADQLVVFDTSKRQHSLLIPRVTARIGAGRISQVQTIAPEAVAYTGSAGSRQGLAGDRLQTRDGP
jgi:hypothetical protein